MSPEVHEGGDGWLFLRGGRNNPFDYLEGTATFGPDLVTAWCDLIEQRARAVGRAEYLHLFAPNKETVYAEEAGLSEEMMQRSPLARLFSAVSPEQRAVLDAYALDPTTYFRRIRHDYQLYWKTDSHWTPTGCFVAYQLICATLGVDQVEDLLGRPFGETEIAMDLGAKLDPPVVEKVRFYRFDQLARRVAANPIVELKEARGLENEAGLHVGSNVVFRNATPKDPRKVVLFGDSFSEYRTVLLTGMLAETFAEAHFVWSTSLDLDYIRREDPDLVLTESVERFMPMVPSNSFDLDRHVSQKLADYQE